VLGGAADEVLDSYQAERLPVAADVLGLSTALHDRAVARQDDAMRRDDPVLRQLALSYRDGPISRELRTAPGLVRAGDRAPDAPCGQGRSRLFDVFRGPHATLLVFGADEELGRELERRFGARLAVHRVPETDIDAYRGYDVGPAAGTPTLFVVRPDGYLGVATAAPDDVEAYLPLLP
jgi:hypothetical protein